MLQYPGNIIAPDDKGYSLAIGFFDGVHKGHQAVIQEAIHTARKLNIPSAVMTFDPHPSHVVTNGRERVQYLTQFNEKCRILSAMGVNHLFQVKFNAELAALSPEQFVKEIIVKLGIKHVTAGFDFRFGRHGAGSMQTMESLANDQYSTTTVGEVIENEEEISSTRIRQLIQNGEVANVHTFLGRYFRLSGIVVDGDKRGRTIGFPTANIEPEEYMIYPANGVYAVKFFVRNKEYDGVCNVGVKPTFNDPSKSVVRIEVNIFDFDEMIYGEQVTVEWRKKIRNERKFDSIEALKAQITLDKERAKAILNPMNK